MSSEKKEVLVVVPARGGSKGVPKKNIRHLAGRPLIAWTIEVARECSSVDRIVVSTDDHAIAEIANYHGAETPFLRPGELAQDDTPDLPVCEHALSWLVEHENYHPDIVVWLRPTAPLRTVQDVKSAVELMVNAKADSVRSVCLVDHHPYWMKRLEGDRLVSFMEKIDEGKYYRRQLLPPVYRLNGAVDVTWANMVMEKKVMFGDYVLGYIMPTDRSVDLDNDFDFALAELLINRGSSSVDGGVGEVVSKMEQTRPESMPGSMSR